MSQGFDATPDATPNGTPAPTPEKLPPTPPTVTVQGPGSTPAPAIKATAKISAPLTLQGPGKPFVSYMVAATRITPRQALALRMLRQGLEDGDARLANGRRIDSQADAVRWLLDQLADQAPPEALES